MHDIYSADSALEERSRLLI